VATGLEPVATYLEFLMVAISPEPDALDWPLKSAGSSIRLLWRKLGAVVWANNAGSFPNAPEEPGIYLIKVTLDGRYRIYIGETVNLRRRLRDFGGRAEERPNQRGKTTTNMRGRVRRTCRAGGNVVVYVLELPVRQLSRRETLDPYCRDCRIMLERLALSVAYVRGEPLINEHGFPEYPLGHPLQ
jgi:hypothetical protein